MLKFLDGPAAGKSLACARAPLFLRVVVDADGNLGAERITVLQALAWFVQLNELPADVPFPARPDAGYNAEQIAGGHLAEWSRIRRESERDTARAGRLKRLEEQSATAPPPPGRVNSARASGPARDAGLPSA